MSPSDVPEPSLRDVLDAVHKIGVLVEQIPGQFRALDEARRSEAERLDRRIDALEKTMADGFQDLGRVVRQNSLDIQKNSDDIRKNSDAIRRNSEEIRALRREITSLRHDFDHRSELGRVTDLEGRVATIERQLGIIPR
jgi:predicted  nucleic acid-binding Zn-ribbon protein